MCGVYGNVLQDLVEMLRFIPTHVGFTLKTDLDGLLKPGSSPRMWGVLWPAVLKLPFDFPNVVKRNQVSHPLF